MRGIICENVWDGPTTCTAVVDTTCPQRKSHTQMPGGYGAWHSKAAELAETHEQRKCGGCGLWAIWVPREAT